MIAFRAFKVEVGFASTLLGAMVFLMSLTYFTNHSDQDGCTGPTISRLFWGVSSPWVVPIHNSSTFIRLTCNPWFIMFLYVHKCSYYIISISPSPRSPRTHGVKKTRRSQPQDIRRYTYEVISQTIAIFCAASSLQWDLKPQRGGCCCMLWSCMGVSVMVLPPLLHYQYHVDMLEVSKTGNQLFTETRL